MKSSFLNSLFISSLLSVAGCFEPSSQDEASDLERQTGADMTSASLAKEIELSFVASADTVISSNCPSPQNAVKWNPITKTVSGAADQGADMTNPSLTDALCPKTNVNRTKSITCATLSAPLSDSITAANSWRLNFDYSWTRDMVSTGARFDAVGVYVTDSTGTVVKGTNWSNVSLSGSAEWSGSQLSLGKVTKGNSISIPISAKDVPLGATLSNAAVHIVLASECTSTPVYPAPAPAKLELKNLHLVPITP